MLHTIHTLLKANEYARRYIGTMSPFSSRCKPLLQAHGRRRCRAFEVSFIPRTAQPSDQGIQSLTASVRPWRAISTKRTQVSFAVES